MSSRKCVYNNCHSYYYKNCKISLFAFPKNVERAEQWRRLGQVHPNISGNQLYMCTKHFDTKYLAKAKNRTILVGEAVPIAYKEEDNVQKPPKSFSTEQILHYNPNANEIWNTNTGKVGDKPPTSSSATLNSYYINGADEDLNMENVDMVESSTANVQHVKKREILDNNEIKVSIVTPSRKRIGSSTPSTSEEEPTSRDDQLIDTAEVSIFKFKDEEYLQMSKDYYLHEKRQMLNQLHCYKRILNNFKKQIMPLQDL